MADPDEKFVHARGVVEISWTSDDPMFARAPVDLFDELAKGEGLNDRYGKKNKFTTEQAYFKCLVCQCDLKSVVSLRAHCGGYKHKTLAPKPKKKKEPGLQEEAGPATNQNNPSTSQVGRRRSPARDRRRSPARERGLSPVRDGVGSPSRDWSPVRKKPLPGFWANVSVQACFGVEEEAPEMARSRERVRSWLHQASTSHGLESATERNVRSVEFVKAEPSAPSRPPGRHQPIHQSTSSAAHQSPQPEVEIILTRGTFNFRDVGPKMEISNGHHPSTSAVSPPPPTPSALPHQPSEQELENQFHRRVAECVHYYLNKYFNDPAQRKIHDVKSYTEMARHFSHKFRDSLKESYRDNNYGSLAGLKLTPDHIESIRVEIEYFFGSLPLLSGS